MNALRKVDPRFTNFSPATAEEAVDRYVRCRRNGLKAMLVPECLIQCSAALSAKELDKFEAWIINPEMDMSNLDLVESVAINKANDAVHAETVARIEADMLKSLPPLPLPSQEEEKMSSPSESSYYEPIDGKVQEVE